MGWYDILKDIFVSQGKPFEERESQKRVVGILEERFEELRNSSIPPLLIRLPCGYGKTLIGEAPFLAQAQRDNWVTRGLTYVLPTRALTSHHRDSIKKDVASLDKDLRVIAFHGDEISTQYFYADVAISTFDVFTYAYARKSRAGYHLEFPAGTIATSYVVFDETQMLQDEKLYSHLVMNRVVRTLSAAGIPVIVMTATMPKPIKEIVFDQVDYQETLDEKMVKLLETEEFRGVISEILVQDKDIENYVQENINPESVRNMRVLVVCNTVRTAQRVYEKIGKILNPSERKGKVILLHSRLEKSEREEREKLVRLLMSRHQQCENLALPLFLNQDEGKVFCANCVPTEKLIQFNFVIVVATQVVEAGLDITSDWLITECAPLDTIVQRVGRCARFKGDKGKVDVLHPLKFLPYPKALIEEAYKLLKERNESLHKIFSNFSQCSDFIDENYRVFEKGALSSNLRSYLAYLEGSGFSTFSIDWKTMKRISARPNAFLTLVLPAKEITVYTSQERRTHEKSLFEITNTINMDYPKFLGLMKEEEEATSLLLDWSWMHEHSITLDVRYATIDNTAKPFLEHKVGEKSFLIELEPVSVSNERGRHYLVSLVESTESLRVKESCYLLNPQYYDSELGLVDDHE